VVHRAAIAVFDQVLLADIGDIGAFLILGEEVVIGLFAPGAKILGDLLVPFLAVGKDGVDVEHHAAKIILTVANDVADGKLARLARGISIRRPAWEKRSSLGPWPRI
jgi:hypothetical protein